MDSLYIFAIIAIILVVLGTILKAHKKNGPVIRDVGKTAPKRPAETLPPSRPPVATAIKPPPQKVAVPIPRLPDRVIIQRKELMLRVGGVQRVYDSNIEIARRHLANGGNRNPSELELLDRAIDLLGNDRGSWR